MDNFKAMHEDHDLSIKGSPPMKIQVPIESQNSNYKIATHTASTEVTGNPLPSEIGSFRYIHKQGPIGVKRSKPKITFQRILEDVLDRSKWREKWTKIKEFVKKGRNKEGQSVHSERNDVFNALLALYAGDEETEVFNELNTLY